MGGYSTPVMENQMEKKMGHEMETAMYIHIDMGLYKDYMSYSLRSLKGGLYRGTLANCIGDYYRGY